jgi:hypothetical protein
MRCGNEVNCWNALALRKITAKVKSHIAPSYFLFCRKTSERKRWNLAHSPNYIQPVKVTWIFWAMTFIMLLFLLAAIHYRSFYCNRLYMLQRHKASAFCVPIVLLFMNSQYIILEGVAVLSHSRFKASNECLLVNRKSNILRLDCQSYITCGTGFESRQIFERVTSDGFESRQIFKRLKSDGFESRQIFKREISERRVSERKEIRWGKREDRKQARYSIDQPL